MLMAHTDVVPAPPEGWTVPPFGGVVRDGHLIGRGAADMKGELAARAVALAEYARSGERPAGDVVLVAEADEERNTADVGMSWLVRERDDLRCDYAINEGGGILLELADGRRVVTISVGEKQVSSLRVRVHGTAGHASVPAAADNPLRYAAEATERLLKAEAPMQMTPAVTRALEALGAPPGRSESDALEWAARLHPILADELPPMTRLTVTPTGLQDIRAVERHPAVRRCDLRLPRPARPGRGRHPRPRHGRAGRRVPVRDRVSRAARGWHRVAGRHAALRGLQGLRGETPARSGAPAPGDTRLRRLALGPWRVRHRVAYGFAPVFATDLDAYLDGAHAANECLAVADLVEMTEFHLHALRVLSR